MIYTSGVVTFLLTKKECHSLKKFKHEMITLEIREEVCAFQKNEKQMRITVDFTAILPRSYECRSLEDYTGKIKPYLQQTVKRPIVSVQISHLNYLSAQAIQTIRSKHR